MVLQAMVPVQNDEQAFVTSGTTTKDPKEVRQMPSDRSNRCAGFTKAGEPCQAAATAGGLCFSHANPNKASELGRIGGTKRRKSGVENTEAPEGENATDLENLVGRLIGDVQKGKFDAGTAAGLCRSSVCGFARLRSSILMSGLKKLGQGLEPPGVWTVRER
jgi:hypothetical protein